MTHPILPQSSDDMSNFPLELLRLLDLFLPRIHFGKPVPSPQGVHSCQEAVSDPTGFSYLKRDLVRLLGILCQGTKAVQERVRRCGGIAVVMNMCVVDERNPCKFFHFHILWAKGLTNFDLKYTQRERRSSRACNFNITQSARR